MPVTPFHLGAALPLKPFAGARFSLSVFVLTQVGIDLESGYNLLLDRWPVHARLHTLPGALGVAVVAVLAGPPVLSRLHRWLAAGLRSEPRVPAWIVAELTDVTWPGALTGALFGAVSHVVLDGMMHPEMKPLWPAAPGNPLYIAGTASFLLIHLGCAISGAVGLLLWARRRAATTRSPGGPLRAKAP